MKKIDRRRVIRGGFVNSIASDLETKTALQSNQKSEDTILRHKAQDMILNRILEGKSKKEIIAELSAHEEYLKYQEVFESWIDNKMSKVVNRQEEKDER